MFVLLVTLSLGDVIEFNSFETPVRPGATRRGKEFFEAMADATRAVDENSGEGTAVGAALAASDVDAGQALAFSIVGGDPDDPVCNRLDADLDAHNADLPALSEFILPGGGRAAGGGRAFFLISTSSATMRA